MKLTKQNPLNNLDKMLNFSIRVGWFDNKKGREGKLPLKSFAGGEALSAKGKTRMLGAIDIARSLQEGGRDVLNAPFENLRSTQIENLVDALKEYVTKSSKKGKELPDAQTQRALGNLATAILRQPMLDGTYKTESKETIDMKGFSRPTIETGQTAKAIAYAISMGG